jgi:NMD protein affecting ribosome stability and mRNA decay
MSTFRERRAQDNPRGGRDQLIRDERSDPYREREKLPDGTRCPDCGAVYREGRWCWGSDSQPRHETRCAACRRIRDGYPAGFLSLRGGFVKEHREEILGLLRNAEAQEKAEHPLKRIMELREVDDGIELTTTDLHLARGLGRALQNAYQGELTLDFVEGETLLRAAWTRES